MPGAHAAYAQSAEMQNCVFGQKSRPEPNKHNFLWGINNQAKSIVQVWQVCAGVCVRVCVLVCVRVCVLVYMAYVTMFAWPDSD